MSEVDDAIIGDSEDISDLILDFSKRDLSIKEKFLQCSEALKLWTLNNYNSHLLHFSLTFPLLRSLYKMGDPIANKVYKGEILGALRENHNQVCRFLIEENYLDDLSKDEIESSTDVLNLTKLILASKRYNNFPEFLLSKTFLKLESLDLTNNSISKIPDKINKLSSLVSLDLSENQFNYFPSVLSNLPNLKELYLHQNKLVDLPDFKEFPFSLEKLDLRSNLLTKITPSIVEIQTLKFLNLENNRLRQIPQFLGDLTSLEVLKLSFNKIKSITNNILRLDHLQTFEVDSSNLDNNSKEILNKIKLKAAKNEASELILKMNSLLNEDLLTNDQKNRLAEKILSLEKSLETDDVKLINRNIDKFIFID